VEQQGNVVEFVPANVQKEALAFLNEQLFVTPQWLVDKDLVFKAQVNPVELIGNVQRNIMNKLLSKFTFDKMIQDEALNGSSAFTVTQMLDMLKSNIWTGIPADVYKRNLQKAYVDALISVLQGSVLPGTTAVKISSDAAGIARLHLMQLKSDVVKLQASSTGLNKAHFTDLLFRINQTLDPK